MAPQANCEAGAAQAAGPLASARKSEREAASNVIGMAGASGPAKPSLVDLLIDSQLDWRQLIGEANGRRPLAAHLSEAQIKRQEIIHELIQTERHHCLTLALMRQVYLSGLLKLNELRQRGAAGATNSSERAKRGSSFVHQLHSQDALAHEPIDIERLFPALEELIQAHELFFAHLRLRLVECCARADPDSQLVGLIGPLGDLLISQFQLEPGQKCAAAAAAAAEAASHSGSESVSPPSSLQKQTTKKKKRPAGKPAAHESTSTNKLQQQVASGRQTNGAKLLQAYAKFCGQHYESSRYFKQLMQFDKGFKQFIEHCNKQHPACRQRGIPECNLLVAQRLTKYPLLIEQLIKTSRDEPNEEEPKLRRALAECRAILAELNAQLARKESFERLLDIYAQFSPKSSTIFYHKQALTFTKHDLLQHKRLRQLLHADDQVRLWSAQRRKLFPVLCLMLDDIIVFLRAEPAGSSSGSSPLASGALSSLDPVSLAPCLHQRHLLEAQWDTASGNSAASSAPELQDQQQQQHHFNQQPIVGAQSAAGGGGQTRYYFANVDNKSSVISLSKLLVREKAVEEAEPRIYLISSSPKQPEMYELAFVSRRHQANFVDKLKASIESHQQSKLGNLRAEPRNAQLSRLSNESLSSCCSDALDNSSLSDSDSASSASSQLERQIEQFIELSGGPEAVAAALVAQGGPQLGELELDIEEALLPEPGDQPAGSTSSVSSAHSTATTPGADDDDSMPLASSEAPNEEAALSAASSPTPGGICERARDSCDETAAPTESSPGKTKASQKLRSVRRRRFQRPRQVSNQSSSSDSGNSSGTTNTEPECARPLELDLKAGELEERLGTNEDLDSGRGHDSSAASSSASSSAGCADSPGHKLTGDESATPTAEDSSSSSQSTGGEDRGSEKDEERLGSLESQLAAGPKAGLSKLARKCEQANKMRKLSSVSSISNQMKLIQRLRSAGLLDTAASLGASSSGDCSSAGYCSPPGQQQQPLDDSLGSLDAHSVAAHVLLAQHKRRLQQSRRRSLFIPEQKLEELRNLRIKLDKDKQEWQEKFDRMQEQLLNERRELDLAREKLKLDRQQVENEREQLYRKLDLLKENGILLSPSHKIIITSPQSQQPSHYQHHHYHHQQQQQQHQQIYSISQNQQHAPTQDQHRFGSSRQQYEASHNLNYQQCRPGHQQPVSRVPLYLSQQSLARVQSVQNLRPSNPLQQPEPQAQQQKQYTSRVPFIGVLPGASFLVKRFSSSGTTPAAGPPTGAETIQARI